MRVLLIYLFVLISITDVYAFQQPQPLDLYILIDEEMPNNQPYFRVDTPLGKQLIELTKNGLILIYDETGREKLDIREFIVKADEKAEVNDQLKLVLKRSMLYDAESKRFYESKSGNSLGLYRESEQGNIEFLASFLLSDIEKTHDQQPMVWKNPFDFTDQRFYEQALIDNMYEGTLLKYKHGSNKLKEVTSEPDLLKLKIQYRDTYAFAQIKYRYEFDMDMSQQTRQTVNCNKLFLTDYWYQLTNQKENAKLWMELRHAVKSGMIRPVANDSLLLFLSYDEFKQRLEGRFKELAGGELKNDDMVMLEMKLPLIYDQKAQSLQIPKQHYTYQDLCGNDQMLHQHVALNVYLAPKYTKSKEKELLVTLYMKEVIQRVMDHNHTLDKLYKKFQTKQIAVKAVAYCDPITGTRVEVKSRKDLELLKSRMGLNASCVDKLVIKGDLVELEQ